MTTSDPSAAQSSDHSSVRSSNWDRTIGGVGLLVAIVSLVYTVTNGLVALSRGALVVLAIVAGAFVIGVALHFGRKAQKGALPPLAIVALCVALIGGTSLATTLYVKPSFRASISVPEGISHTGSSVQASGTLSGTVPSGANFWILLHPQAEGAAGNYYLQSTPCAWTTGSSQITCPHLDFGKAGIWNIDLLLTDSAATAEFVMHLVDNQQCADDKNAAPVCQVNGGPTVLGTVPDGTTVVATTQATVE